MPLFTSMRERSTLKTEDFFFLFVKVAPVFLVKFEHPPPSEVQSLSAKFESLGDVLLRRLNDDTFSGERMPGMSIFKIRKYGLVYTRAAQTYKYNSSLICVISYCVILKMLVSIKFLYENSANRF